ncbi:ATP-binding protein [Shewanella ulleungensis]|uniref:histidine kinase n=1 Tax=Shewanella ulleungensis TaxID=2282699 RepID=A0ABQ2QEB7_9GAMM|nr:ATP-binding protein [Shewanella ulleungensis]MCL1148859.1 ATP-binding protein [Shewanella ulleungensis]GGP75164.1 hypothetical protein GCM10009410_04030 [Shewanella ulleungensis]
MQLKPSSISVFKYVFSGVITISIFIVDNIISLKIAVAVLYVIVVLLAVEIFSRRGVILVSLVCITLTITAFFINHGLEMEISDLARCLVSLAAISITTLLALKSKNVKKLLQQQVYLLSQTHDAILTCDMNGIITSWNQGAYQLYGWQPEQAIGKQITELIGTPTSAMKNLINSGHYEGELIERHQSGSKVVVSSRWSLALDVQQRGYSILISNNDLTASRKLDEQLSTLQTTLEQANRLSTLGQMSASLAHEINQPLASISMNAEASLRWMNRLDPVLAESRLCINAIVNEARRAAEIIKRIRMLSRKGSVTLSNLDLREVISETMLLLEKEFQRHSVQTSLNVPDETEALVYGDKIQLQQILINLLVNGIQAMESIETKQRYLSVDLKRHQSHWVIQVKDSGKGIDESELPLIFDAFYSTKNEGMGMGLSISRSIAEAHDGLLWTDDATKDETIFYLQLPILHTQVVQ